VSYDITVESDRRFDGQGWPWHPMRARACPRACPPVTHTSAPRKNAVLSVQTPRDPASARVTSGEVQTPVPHPTFPGDSRANGQLAKTFAFWSSKIWHWRLADVG